MLETYIKNSWTRLRRNSFDVALDPKVSGGMYCIFMCRPMEMFAAIKLLIAKRSQRRAKIRNGRHEGFA